MHPQVNCVSHNKTSQESKRIISHDSPIDHKEDGGENETHHRRHGQAGFIFRILVMYPMDGIRNFLPFSTGGGQVIKIPVGEVFYESIEEISADEQQDHLGCFKSLFYDPIINEDRSDR